MGTNSAVTWRYYSVGCVRDQMLGTGTWCTIIGGNRIRRRGLGVKTADKRVVLLVDSLGDKMCVSICQYVSEEPLVVQNSKSLEALSNYIGIKPWMNNYEAGIGWNILCFCFSPSCK